MLKSLNSKVVFSIILVIILGVFLSAFAIFLTVRYQMSQKYGIEKEAAIESLSLALADDLNTGNIEQIHETIKSALVYENIISVTVFQIDGTVVAAISENDSGVKTSDYSKHTLSVDGISIGSFEVGFSSRYIDDLIENTVIAMIIVIAGFLLLTGITFFVFIRHSILQPIHKFTDGIKEVTTDNLAVKIDINSEDEIGFMAKSFNSMTEKLENSQRELNQYQNELEEKVEQRTRGERRRSEQLRTINEVGRRISSFLSLDELLPYVANSLRETFHYHVVNIFLVNEDNSGVEFRTGAGENDNKTPVKLRFNFSEGVIGSAAGSGEYILIPDMRTDKKYSPGEELPGTMSELTVPIKLGTGIIGVLDLRSKDLNAFDEIDVFTVQTIGDQLAIAIQNARLFKETHELAVITERNRMAREIHDTFAQGFTGILLQLEAAEQSLEENKELSLKHLDTARNLARENLNEARRSVWALRPHVLENKTLIEALRSEADKFSAENGINTKIVMPEGLIVKSESENALLRITQEAFNNIRKHAQAKNVTLTLIKENESVLLTITDDGTGFDMRNDMKDRYGLISMRERAKLLGGSFEIVSEKGKGTRLTVRLP